MEYTIGRLKVTVEPLEVSPALEKTIYSARTGTMLGTKFGYGLNATEAILDLMKQDS